MKAFTMYSLISFILRRMTYLNFLLLHHLSPLLAYIGIFFVLFAESGLLIGFFLPGDSLVFPLGLLAAQGHFSLFILIILCITGQ
jgi:membrane protein DedA with SNARE-associated domain